MPEKKQLRSTFFFSAFTGGAGSPQLTFLYLLKALLTGKHIREKRIIIRQEIENLCLKKNICALEITEKSVANIKYRYSGRHRMNMDHDKHYDAKKISILFLQHVKRRTTMNKHIWLAAGISGILLANLTADVQAERRFHSHGWGGYHGGWRGSYWVGPYWGWGDPYWGWYGPAYVIDTRPRFIVLPDYGFSVSIGTPYDMIYYDNLYYVYNNNYWYSALGYRGPWAVIQEDDLPDIIRKHRIDEIRKARDTESDNNGNHENRGHNSDINSGKHSDNTHNDNRSDEQSK